MTLTATGPFIGLGCTPGLELGLGRAGSTRGEVDDERHDPGGEVGAPPDRRHGLVPDAAVHEAATFAEDDGDGSDGCWTEERELSRGGADREPVAGRRGSAG